MTDYSTLSDAEINKLVAEALKLKGIHERAGRACYISHNGSRFFEPCTNPSDAWPIIFDNKISLFAPAENYDEWKAEAAGNYEYDDDFWKDYATTHTNPLRAAMIVFLMMHDTTQ